MAAIEVQHLGPADTVAAQQLFALMSAVFDEEAEPLTARDIQRLLARRDFWALAARFDGEISGGLTAHTLPMTRGAFSEIFIYDLAVRADRRRLGIGRQLVRTLRELAAAEGIHDLFVPADNEDTHALEFYRALGGTSAAVTIFSFSR